MKRAWLVMGLTGALAVAGTQPASAINKEWSTALGFVGGLIVGSHIERDRDCGPRYQRYSPPSYTYEQRTVYVPQPVYIEQPRYEAPRCEPPPPPRCEPRGHYEYREERRWIEGSWRSEKVGCNVIRKTWCPGRWETTTVKVWVPGW